MIAMYQSNGKLSVADEAKKYMPLVKKTALHLCARLPPNVMPEDMVQVGFIAMMDVLKKADSGRGPQFEAYAVMRMRGAMLDELRKADYYPRSVRDAQKMLEDAEDFLRKKLLRKPSSGEIAEKLGLSMDDYISLVSSSVSGVVSTETEVEGDDGATSTNYLLDRLMIVESHHCDLLETRELKQALVDAISELPEREQLVLTMYYQEELVLAEIALILGVNESRASQIFNKAMISLKDSMAEWADHFKS